MTVFGWIALGCYLLGIGLYLWIEGWFGVRRQREVAAMLDEVRRCNDELAEALALAEYGAVEEAAEVATRWRTRMDPVVISRALGGTGVRRVSGIRVERRGGA